MPLCYFACVPATHTVQYQELVGIAHQPSTFAREPRVVCYNFTSYAAMAGAWYNGTAGKWITTRLFVPPLALFVSVKEAEEMLRIECAASM